jgi:hypothetical protein
VKVVYGISKKLCKKVSSNGFYLESKNLLYDQLAMCKIVAESETVLIGSEEIIIPSP